MWETEQELADLQRLIDDSFARSSAHLTSIMSASRRLTAAGIVADLPSPAVLNIATVTALGQPRISAVDGHFLHGRWYFTTDVSSPKAVQLRARPGISASYTPRDGYAVFCHGHAVELPPGAQRQMVVDHFTATYGQSPQEWGIGVFYARIDPSWFVGFAMTAEEEAEVARQRARARTGG